MCGSGEASMDRLVRSSADEPPIPREPCPQRRPGRSVPTKHCMGAGSHPARRYQLRLVDLAALPAILGAAIWIVVSGGSFGAAILVLLSVLYGIARAMPRRLRWMALATCLTCTLFPMTGIGSGRFSYPGSQWSLPDASLGIPISVRDDALRVGTSLFDVISLPVVVLAARVGRWNPIVYFSGEGVRRARPFTVSYSWLCMVSALLVAEMCSKRRGQHEP